MNIKKSKLALYYQFLNKLELTGVDSRARTKLTKDMGEAITELQEDEKTLAEEVNASVDENGNVSFRKPEDKITFVKAQIELKQEEVVFEEKTMDQFDKLKNALLDYDEKLSGQDAEAYDSILDDLEK